MATIPPEIIHGGPLARIKLNKTLEQTRIGIEKSPKQISEDAIERYREDTLSYCKKFSVTHLSEEHIGKRIMKVRVSYTHRGEPSIGYMKEECILLEIQTKRNEVMQIKILSECDKCEARPKDGVALRRCTRCKMVAYCCKECQLYAWNKWHKDRCRPWEIVSMKIKDEYGHVNDLDETMFYGWHVLKDEQKPV